MFIYFLAYLKKQEVLFFNLTKSMSKFLNALSIFLFNSNIQCIPVNGATGYYGRPLYRVSIKKQNGVTRFIGQDRRLFGPIVEQFFSG